MGDSPRLGDVERGRPFTGPPGKTLEGLLRTAEIERSDCLVTNVFNTILEGDSVSKHQVKYREIWEAFKASNLLRLESELAQAGPNVVVALGPTAFAALTGINGITAYRGTVRLGAGPFEIYKVAPTYHPEEIQKRWSLYTIAVGDLVRARQEAETQTLTYPKRALYITPTIDEVERFLSGPCTQSDLLSVDIETGWGQIRGVNFAPNQYEAMYVPFIWLANTNRSYWKDHATERRAWLAVKACLESETPKLGQNFANYDVVWLLDRVGIRVRNLAHDLRLLHKSLYPELSASLQFMGAAYSRQGAWKHWGKGKKHGGSEEDKRDA